MIGSSIPRKRANSYAKGAGISRPLGSLPNFYQLDAKILHCLQGAMKLSLITKYAQQNRAAWPLLDLKSQRLQRCNERVSQLTAHPDFVAEAPSASAHDRGFWLVPVEVFKDMRPPHVDSARWSDNGSVLSTGAFGITPQG
jgi:hypothetical protein